MSRWRPHRGHEHRRRERGSLAIELVILTPLLVIFMMILVGLGRFVEVQGQVAGAARDAARAASDTQDAGTALSSAQQTADADLTGGSECASTPRVSFGGDTDLAPGGQVNVVVSCTIRLTGLSLAGFAPTKVITAEASAPIDTYSMGG